MIGHQNCTYLYFHLYMTVLIAIGSQNFSFDWFLSFCVFDVEWYVIFKTDILLVNLGFIYVCIRNSGFHVYKLFYISFPFLLDSFYFSNQFEELYKNYETSAFLVICVKNIYLLVCGFVFCDYGVKFRTILIVHPGISPPLKWKMRCHIIGSCNQKCIQ